MSHKDYKIEIVQNLLKLPNHVRGLAKGLKTNQTTIARKLKELEKNNVVDYKEEGRNKVYFIKNTLEAWEYALVSEHYKLVQALNQYSLLRKIVKEIKINPKIRLALLFGSYAKGLAHKDSDIDVYIETKSKEIKNQVELINTKLNVKTGLYDKDSLLIKEIEKNHIIIKGAEIYYEKTRFFS